MKHIFIINPTAGKCRALDIIPDINNYFKSIPEECIIKITEYSGHATEIAKEYASKEQCRFYSVGGDGTVNEVVNGIVGTTSSLSVLPAGSGNDFLRSISSDMYSADILKKTVEGEEKSIDLAKVNGKYFINISSIGFDAEVVFNAKKFKKIPLVPGNLAYLFSILYSLFQKKIHCTDVTVDGKTVKVEMLLAAVANGRYYGGGMLPTPYADVRDGLLDVCLVTEISRLKILRFFPRYIKGHHEIFEEVQFLKAKKVQIKCKEQVCVNIDGEIIRTEMVDFEIIHNAINVVFPVGSAAIKNQNKEEQLVSA